VTLNDLKRRNNPCVILSNSTALHAHYITVLEDRPIISAKYRLPVIYVATNRLQLAFWLHIEALRLCAQKMF